MCFGIGLDVVEVFWTCFASVLHVFWDVFWKCFGQVFGFSLGKVSTGVVGSALYLVEMLQGYF